MLSLGLSLWSSTILGRGDPYAVLGIRPELVFDFEAETYRTDSAPTSFSSAITHTRAGNATMVDSDGVLKWAPHNLALNSAAPATQDITVVSGADYTIECTGVSIALSGAGTGTVTEGNPVEITASTTTLTLTVTGSTGTMWVYRSDLGGMVNNPDTGNSYVPTTDSAVYLPRRGHHVYNGSTWINEGLLHESEARTNLSENSENFSADWSTSRASISVDQSTAPDGNSTADKIVDTAESGTHSITYPVSGSASVHTFSVFAKADERDWIVLYDADALVGMHFDLTEGVVGSNFISTPTDYGIIEYGNGWYRCYITYTATTSNRNRIYLAADDNGTNYTGSGTDGVFIWGHQFEAGSTPSSYIPTSGSTVTRPAETLTVPAANLPWPTPNVIGPELVTNGTFDTDVSGWTARNATISQIDYADRTNVLSVADGGAFSQAWQTITTEAGKVYRLEFLYAEQAGAGQPVYLDVYDGAGAPAASIGDIYEFSSSDGNSSSFTSAAITFVAQSSETTIAPRSNSTETAYFDNISVREIDPLSVSIQMDGTATGNTYTPTRWYLDANNAILQDIGSTDFTFTQEAAGVVDTVTGGSFTSGVNTPLNIASRHGSTFINGAVDGVALTADITPVALPDLETTDLNLGYDYMGTIKTFRVWADDLGDTGIEEASS